MEEYGTFDNTDISEQNIIYDRKSGIDNMASQFKEPSGGYKNPIEVNERSGIYYRSQTENERPQVSIGSNYYQNKNEHSCCMNPKRTSLENCLLKIVVIFLIILLGSYMTFFCYIKYGHKTWSENLVSKYICHSPSCVESAGEVIKWMDEGVKPCDNFYEFACGGWKSQNPAPNNKERWDTFTVAFEKIHHQLKENLEEEPNKDEPFSVKQLRTGYSACLNQSAWNNLGAEPLVELLEEFGGLPMITPHWDEESFKFLTTLAKLIREYNEKFIIGIYVIPDMKNSSRFALHMEKGKLPVDRYLLAVDDKVEREKQIERMTTVANMLLEPSIQRFRERKKQKPEPEPEQNSYVFPLFHIPANNSYVITQKDGYHRTLITGQTYEKIYSNNTKITTPRGFVPENIRSKWLKYMKKHAKVQHKKKDNTVDADIKTTNSTDSSHDKKNNVESHSGHINPSKNQSQYSERDKRTRIIQKDKSNSSISENQNTNSHSSNIDHLQRTVSGIKNKKLKNDLPSHNHTSINHQNESNHTNNVEAKLKNVNDNNSLPSNYSNVKSQNNEFNHIKKELHPSNIHIKSEILNNSEHALQHENHSTKSHLSDVSHSPKNLKSFGGEQKTKEPKFYNPALPHNIRNVESTSSDISNSKNGFISSNDYNKIKIHPNLKQTLPTHNHIENTLSSTTHIAKEKVDSYGGNKQTEITKSNNQLAPPQNNIAKSGSSGNIHHSIVKLKISEGNKQTDKNQTINNSSSPYIHNEKSHQRGSGNVAVNLNVSEEKNQTKKSTNFEQSKPSSDSTESDESAEDNSSEEEFDSSEDYVRPVRIIRKDAGEITPRLIHKSELSQMEALSNKFRYRSLKRDPDIELPLFMIPPDHAYTIRKVSGNVIIKANGETFKPLYSDNPRLFRQASRIKNKYYRPYVEMEADDNTYINTYDNLVMNLIEKKTSITDKEPITNRELTTDKPSEIPEFKEDLKFTTNQQHLFMKKDIAELWDFYRSLATIMKSDSTNKDLYNSMTVGQLHEFNGDVLLNWNSFLSNVMSDTGISIDNSTTVVISQPSYFMKLIPLLKKTPPRVLANAVLFQLILNMGTEIAPYRERTEEFIGRYENRQWYDCTQKMNSLMGLASARLYYDGKKTEIEEDIKGVSEMVTNLKTALFSSMAIKPWLDTETKDMALKKVHALIPIVGFNQKYLNNSKLDDEYEMLPDLNETDHFGNIRKLLRYTSHKSLSYLNKTPSREDFLSSPLDVNGFYSIQRNNIQIPMGILMSPFFRREASKSFQYGATGSVISHEISHGFDVKGRKWDYKGTLNKWWTRNSLKHYMKKAHCYAEEYKEFPLTFDVKDTFGEPIKINSKRTLAENIADAEGLRLSWRAYMVDSKEDKNNSRMIGLEKYSPQQLFFIGYAQMWCSNYSPLGMKRSLILDVHSPHPSRVNGAIRNHPEFVKVFNCPSNSTMFADVYCSIW